MTELPRFSHPVRAQGFGRRAVAQPAPPVPAAEAAARAHAAETVRHADAPEAERHSAYLARHWHGELSLGTAYWINGALIGTLFAALAAGVDFAVGRHFTPMTWLVYLIVYWLAHTALTIWQSVGIWISASLHPGRGGRASWARTAKISVALGLIGGAYDFSQRAVPQMDDALQIVAGDAMVGPHHLALADGGRMIDVQGGIAFGLTDEVKALLDANPGVRVVMLDSPGGRVGEAEQLRDLIRARQLWTYVSGDCLSACTTVFLGGIQRWANHRARLGFHRPFGAGLYAYEEQAIYIAAVRDLEQWGVAPRFAERAMATPSHSMWFPTPAEYMAAGVVTGLAGPEMLAKRLELAATPAGAEHVLATHPLFAVIAKYEPLAMADIQGSIVYNFDGEKTLAGVVDHVFPQLTRLHYKYLPVASDAMVVEGAEVFLDEVRAMRTKRAEACAFFLNQHRGVTAFHTSIRRAFDDALLNRFVAAVQGAIESGAAAPRTPPTEEIGVPLLNKLVAGLAAGDSRGAAVLGQFESDKVDPVEACTTTEKLFEAALALPEPERITALRYLFILRR